MRLSNYFMKELKIMSINTTIKKRNSYQLHQYGKWCYSYEGDAIYLIDKLHISFKSDYTSGHFKNAKAEDVYQLDSFVEIQKERSRNTSFNQCYQVIVSGYSFGYLNCRHTQNKKNVYLELTNQFLYCQSTYDIIKNLDILRTKLNLTSSTVSLFELARDSTKNIYRQFGLFFYQSDLCPSEVHTAHNSEPMYTGVGRKGYRYIISDPNEPNHGTAYIGRSNSDIQIKLYDKSTELLNWGVHKSYISEIHNQHFLGKVYRSEVRTNGRPIKSNQWSLEYLLNPENHSLVFRTLVGTRLSFKNLSSRYYDQNRNYRYEVIDLIPPLTGVLNQKTFKVKNVLPSSHGKNINKIKSMLWMFLDGEISSSSLLDFIVKNKANDPFAFDIAIEKAITNYQNPRNTSHNRKLKFIYDLVDAGTSSIRLLSVKINYQVGNLRDRLF